MNLQESIRNDLKLFEEQEFAGYIAIYNNEKLEIGKDEANGIYDAKQIAIAHFKIPKSKQGLLAIEPAYEELTEEGEEQSSSDNQRTLQMLTAFRELYKEIKSLDTRGYALDEYKENMLRELYHKLIINQFTKRSGDREGIPDLDGSHFNHPID